MKIALTPALLLGLAGVASGFPCLWNGAGSSYVYENVESTDNTNCMQTIYSVHQQTTCCRCANAAECNDNTDIDTPDYNSIGCDLYPPQITIGDSAGGAALPAQWFTSADQLERYLQSTVQCQDDCVLEPTCNIHVDYADSNQDPYCGATPVTVTSSDWVGCNNQNTATKTFLVRYDAVPPTVTVNLGEFAYKALPKERLEQVALTVGVADVCDPNPEVSITVYSDEQALTPEKTPAALLARTYDSNGDAAGWNLWLDRRNYAIKMCEKDIACQVPDGRYYVVRVCARDQAGLVTCAEDSVGVPLKYSLDKKIDPINEGKLFVVAEDTVWWDEQPNPFGYRPENTDLTYGAVNFGYESARLCYSNRGVDGTPLATVNLSMGGSDFCNVQCSNASGCNGFTFQPTNQEGAGVCTIYGALGDADPTITTGVNIYAVGGTVCPDIV